MPLLPWMREVKILAGSARIGETARAVTLLLLPKVVGMTVKNLNKGFENFELRAPRRPAIIFHADLKITKSSA